LVVVERLAQAAVLQHLALIQALAH